MAKNPNPIITKTLSNGLRLLIQSNPNSPSVAAVVLVGVGSRYETADDNGISHFLEHMAFKGTDKRPTTQDIAMAVDAVGGESNAFTGKEYTGYYVKVASQHLNLATDLLEDMLWHSKYVQDECDRERNVIIEEINMYRDSPRDQAAEYYDKLVYPDQSLGMEVAGTPESLSHIQSATLRDFNRHWYVPNNMVVAISGNVEVGAVEEQVNKLFKGRDQAEIASYQAANSNQDKPQLVVQTKPVDQTQLIVGWRSFAATHPDRYTLALISTMLGGNMSSRLFTEVREKRGLAYAVNATVDDFLDAGSINAQAGLGPQNVDQALQVILEQFNDVKQGGVTTEELERAKQYMAGRLALSTEDGLSTVIYHGRQWLLEGQITSLDQIMAGFNKVTLDDVTRVAQQLFTPKGLNVVALGPTVDKDSLQKLIDKVQ